MTSSPALTFELLGKCSVSDLDLISMHRLTQQQVTKARAAMLHLPHGPVPLPIFMPVATQASLKGLTPEQLEDQGCRLCLNNTYHLYDAAASTAHVRASTNTLERP
jgi:tRNA-guanine family transglycosylase